MSADTDLNLGRCPSGRATQASPQAPSGLGHPVSVPNATTLRERIAKVRDGYASQMRFCDIEAMGYFREFVRRIDAAMDDGWEDACPKCDDSGYVEFVSGGIWTGENITTRREYCDCACGQDARDQAIRRLAAAINAVMDSSGARGTYHALRYADAVEALESTLASISIPEPAQGMSAGTAETLQAAQGVARQPGR